jgi:hypothetical protein
MKTEKQDLQEHIFTNSVVKGLLEQIEDPKEKEKTVIAIKGMLQLLQGKVDGLSKAYEEIAKKQDPK